MKIAVLSGKGGTGKTFVSVNLAVAAKNATYIDCDVEEPNGRLYFKPEGLKVSDVEVQIPYFDENKCNGCRKCVDFCKFNALVYIKKVPKLFTGICHSCGGCAMVCPTNAIEEKGRLVGKIEEGYYKDVKVVTGIMNLSEESGVSVIKNTLKKGYKDVDTVVIDCPPGSACSVVESIEDSDFCILVAEPTIFGLHNLKMVVKLVRLLKKPCCIVINKESNKFEELEDFCNDNDIKIAMRIPFSDKLAKIGATGKIAVEEDDAILQEFENLLNRIQRGDFQ